MPIKNYFDRVNEAKKNKSEEEKRNKVIALLTHYRQFKDVLQMDAFKVLVEDEIGKHENDCLIMADINNLREINELNGLNKVDEMIQDFIFQLRGLLNFQKIECYKIGKRGDEIYLYIPNIEEEKYKKIIEVANQLRYGPVTVSAGGSKVLSNGLQRAMELAEKDMSEHKKERKKQEFAYIAGDNMDDILETWLKKVFVKLRIVGHEELDESQRATFLETIIKRNRFKDNLIVRNESFKQDVLRQVNNVVEQPKDKTLEIKNQKEQELEDTSLTKEEKQKAILAEVLTTEHIDGYKYEKEAFFKEIGVSEFLNSSTKKTIKVAEDMSLFLLDIGNIKYLNDLEGYEKTDEEIARIVNNFSEKLDELEIEKKYNIIVRGIGEYMALIPRDIDDNKIDELTQYLQAEEPNAKLSINYSKPVKLVRDKKRKIWKEHKYDNPKCTFLELFYDAMNICRKEIEVTKFQKKIRDTERISNLMANQITILKNHPLVQIYIEQKQQETGKTEMEILDELIDEAVGKVLNNSEKKSLEKEEKEKPEEMASMEL